MEIIFRGKNTKDEWVEGSLVTTNRFIRHKPKNHSKHWIVETSFGNGGWFNVQRKQYVKSDTLEMKFLDKWIPVEQVDEELLMKTFRKMCQESLDPETYEMSEIVEKNLRLVRSNLI